MRKRELFYYLYENNEKEYVEITNMIVEIAGFSSMTDEQELFMKDLYFRVLFGIALITRGYYEGKDILKEFNYLFDDNKLNEIKCKFSIVIDMIREKLNKIGNDVKED